MFHEVFNSQQAMIGTSMRRPGTTRRHSNVNFLQSRANTYKLLAMFGFIDGAASVRATTGCQRRASVIRCIHART
jgi:hypothetical protein